VGGADGWWCYPPIGGFRDPRNRSKGRVSLHPGGYPPCDLIYPEGDKDGRQYQKGRIAQGHQTQGYEPQGSREGCLPAERPPGRARNQLAA